MRSARRHTLSRFVAFTVLLGAMASPSLTSAQQKKRTELTEHFVYDKVRIFYVKEGTGAVSPVDVDQNGVPDQVENVAKQIWAAHRLFCDVLKFPDPFESERY
tara:strand:- start:46 stop:354 length:309 start_codon:yes stop_codon:yes gene_type:complete